MEHTKKGGAMLGAKYVQDRKIAELFQTLIASLVCHRPEDHISFLLENLIEIRDGKETFLSRLHAQVRATSPLLPPLEHSRTKPRPERLGKKKKLKQPRQQTPGLNQDLDKDVSSHACPPPETLDLFGASRDVANQIKAQPPMTLPINVLPPLQKSRHRKTPLRTGIILAKDSRRRLAPSKLNDTIGVYKRTEPPIPGVKKVDPAHASKGGPYTKGKEDETKCTISAYLTDGGQGLNRTVVRNNKKRQRKDKLEAKIFSDMRTWPTHKNH